MHIETLTLKNFRNYENLSIRFSPEVNFIIGENGTGKTNIIEAISVAANIKSFRNIHDTEIIQWGKKSYYIAVEAGNTASRKFEIGCAHDTVKKIRKKAKIDGIAVKKTGEYFGKLLTVIFSPVDISILNEAPELRRKFFDSVISKIDPKYYEELSEFKKVLLSRNRLLKNLKNRNKTEYRQLDVWDQLFSERASALIQKRMAFAEKYNRLFTESYQKISDEELYPEIAYHAATGTHGIDAIADILKKNREKDVILGFTGIGPQRDDYVFKNGKGKLFSDYASQGQKRTAAVSLKLSECEIIEASSNEKCILLVDDIFSELDVLRRTNLLARLKAGNQVIFTMVHEGILNMNDFSALKKFIVEKGARIKEI